MNTCTHSFGYFRHVYFVNDLNGFDRCSTAINRRAALRLHQNPTFTLLLLIKMSLNRD